MRYAGFLTLSALLITATPTAEAQRDRGGGGWSAWEWRVHRMNDAIRSGDKNQLEATCSGLRETINKSGIRFPNWAVAASTGCGMMVNVMEGSNGNPHRTHIICRELKRSGNQLGKATEVAEAPNADNLARQLGVMLIQIYQAACHGKVD